MFITVGISDEHVDDFFSRFHIETKGDERSISGETESLDDTLLFTLSNCLLYLNDHDNR